jgi:hypothetical protein
MEDTGQQLPLLAAETYTKKEKPLKRRIKNYPCKYTIVHIYPVVWSKCGHSNFITPTNNRKNKSMPDTVTAKSYTLRTESGQWLGQVILTSDGVFASVTDYGNFSYAWRSTGEKDFREFIISLNNSYFGDKMYTGMSYIAFGKKIDKACERFAEKILPPLQAILKAEIEAEKQTP